MIGSSPNNSGILLSDGEYPWGGSSCLDAACFLEPEVVSPTSTMRQFSFSTHGSELDAGHVWRRLAAWAFDLEGIFQDASVDQEQFQGYSLRE